MEMEITSVSKEACDGVRVLCWGEKLRRKNTAFALFVTETYKYDLFMSSHKYRELGQPSIGDTIYVRVSTEPDLEAENRRLKEQLKELKNSR